MFLFERPSWCSNKFETPVVVGEHICSITRCGGRANTLALLSVVTAWLCPCSNARRGVRASSKRPLWWVNIFARTPVVVGEQIPWPCCPLWRLGYVLVRTPVVVFETPVVMGNHIFSNTRGGGRVNILSLLPLVILYYILYICYFIQKGSMDEM